MQSVYSDMRRYLVLLTIGSFILKPVCAITTGESQNGKTTFQLSQESRRISVVIQIINYSDEPLYGPECFAKNGKCPFLPPVVEPMTKEVAIFQRSFLGWKTSGVLVYNIGNQTEPKYFKLAVIFGVSKFTSNWYGIQFIRSDKPVNSKLYQNMYDYPSWGRPSLLKTSKFAYASDRNIITIKLEDYIVEAFMTTNEKSRMKVSIYKTPIKTANETHDATREETPEKEIDYDDSFPTLS